jgi:hypothetical protein
MFYVDQSTQKRYTIGTPFDYNERQYTKAGATHDKFIELGFTQVIIQQRPDDRFYIVSGPNAAGEYDSTPRDLDQLKLQFILQQKTTARQLLSESDWYVLREAEGGAGVPADFRDYRVSVRATADARCAEIFAAATVDALEALIKAPAELYDSITDQMNPNGNAMTQWPTPLSLEAVVAESYGLAEDEGASGGY